MSIKYATALVKAGEVMPSEIATIIAKEYSTGYGYAIAFEGVLDVGKELGAVDAPLLIDLMEKNRAATLLLWFCKSDNPLLEDDLQPFSLIEDNIAVCLTGDFSQYAQTGSSHTNEGLAIEKIRQKALKLWKSNDSNMDTFSVAMSDPEEDDTVETMASWVPENSAIAFLMSSGQCAGFGNPEDREQEHPWGWTYGAPPTAETKAEPPPATSKVKLSLKKSGDTATATATTPKPAPEKSEILQGRFVDVRTQKVVVKDVEYDFQLALKQDGVNPIDVMDSDILVRPPGDVDNKDRITSWYKGEVGYVPHNWKRRPWIKPKGPTNVVKLADLPNSTAAAALQTAAKDTANKFIPPPKVVGKEVVKHFLEVDYPKLLGNNSEFIQNPDKVMAEEEKDPSLAAMMNDKRFIDISSFDMPRVSRTMLLQHIGGPASEFWVAFADAWIRDNMLARRNLQKQLQDAKNTIVNQAKEIDTFRSAATHKAAAEAQAGNAGATQKVKLSLKK